MTALARFVRESNRIEGIHGDPTEDEVQAHVHFLAGPVSVEALERFVSIVQPGASLRRQPGMNVRVGPHVAPPGGPDIESDLRALLDWGWPPWEEHVHYESLHPFMDGNGRSGRVLWLHRMGGIGNAPLGFLHTFYYQTLESVRRTG